MNPDHAPTTVDRVNPNAGGRWPLDIRAGLETLAAYAMLCLLGCFLAVVAIDWLGPELAGPVVDWFVARRSPTLDSAAGLGSFVADTFVLGTVVVVVFVVLAWLVRRITAAAVLGLALGLEVTVFLTVSTIVDRARPQVEQLDHSPPTASFPSGHVGGTAAFWLVIAVIVFWNTRHGLLRVLTAAAALVMPAVVAVSRLYLGMHFLTDVVAGALLGALAAVAAIAIVVRARDRQTDEEEAL